MNHAFFPIVVQCAAPRLCRLTVHSKFRYGRIFEPVTPAQCISTFHNFSPFFSMQFPMPSDPLQRKILSLEFAQCMRHSIARTIFCFYMAAPFLFPRWFGNYLGKKIFTFDLDDNWPPLYGVVMFASFPMKLPVSRFGKKFGMWPNPSQRAPQERAGKNQNLFCLTIVTPIAGANIDKFVQVGHLGRRNDFRQPPRIGG